MSDAWQAVADLLAAGGCELVAGVPADEPGLLDAADDHPGLTALVVRDQRVGACLVAGHALLSGRPAVLALTTGPAFTNALAGLAEAASLCVPIVVVTTRVPDAERGRGAFQEVDQRALAATFAKWHATVERPEGVRWALRRAVAQAVNGRPGVTVVELAPECLADRAGVGAERGERPLVRSRAVPAADELARAAALLAQARRPVVVLGGGARAAGAQAAAARLADAFPAAYATTASGRGTFDEAHPLACGNVGLYATPPLDVLLDDADVVLVLGSQLEETMRMRWPRLAAAALVHVDCEPLVFGQAIEPAVALVGDAAATCDALARLLAPLPRAADVEEWCARIAQARHAAAAEHAQPAFSERAACATLRALADAFPDAVFVQENGLQDLWGYHHPVLRAGAGHAFVAPGEQTMMGFGIGAAIGAAVAAPARTVVATCGDGALGMSLAALPTAAACSGRLLLVMWDNGGLGWPRLGRAGAERPRLTDFATPPPAATAVQALGGATFAVASERELTAAVAGAQAALADGRLALLTVAAHADALPPAARDLTHPAAAAA
ncbi:MAG TPA: thiamine pyrophosphate-binding protein [Conexibacter sp.]|nr:thiamine pyrophosphate-binding protein [Conexibacter sp.]